MLYYKKRDKMKKQTTDETREQKLEDIDTRIYLESLSSITGLGLAYDKCLADVEKMIDKLEWIGKVRLKAEIAKIHSQKQAKQLQEGKFDIISQTAFELKCSPDNDPNANKGEGK